MPMATQSVQVRAEQQHGVGALQRFQIAQPPGDVRVCKVRIEVLEQKERGRGVGGDQGQNLGRCAGTIAKTLRRRPHSKLAFGAARQTRQGLSTRSSSTQPVKVS